MRVFGGVRLSKYAHQLTFDAKDPYRRDRTVQAGVSWNLDSPLTIELGVDGTMNRSNSRRPEYDAVSARGLVSVPLPLDVGATLLAVWTKKSYVDQGDFKVLVPGHGKPMTRSGFATYRRAFDRLLDCAGGPSAKPACVDGWMRDAGRLIPADDEKLARSLLDYYIDGNLRAPAAEKEKLCSA